MIIHKRQGIVFNLRLRCSVYRNPMNIVYIAYLKHLTLKTKQILFGAWSLDHWKGIMVSALVMRADTQNRGGRRGNNFT